MNAILTRPIHPRGQTINAGTIVRLTEMAEEGGHPDNPVISKWWEATFDGEVVWRQLEAPGVVPTGPCEDLGKFLDQSL